MCTLPTETMDLPPASSVEGSGAKWYALYTAPRHEKMHRSSKSRVAVSTASCLVTGRCDAGKIAAKNWKSCCFPVTSLSECRCSNRFQILQLPGAVRLVTFNGQPATLPDDEIESLRNRLSGNCRMEPHPYLRVGRRVRVHSGPMQGLEGIIQRTRDRCRVIFSVDLIMRSIAVEVDEADVELT